MRKSVQFGKKIITFPAVDMLSRMKAKLDAGRSLYQTARFVDIYKALRHFLQRKLYAEERQRMKKFRDWQMPSHHLPRVWTRNMPTRMLYDAISIHGGSGFIMEYKSQRLFRDARIFSIYEGTTQLQVVAAIRYITNGTLPEHHQRDAW